MPRRGKFFDYRVIASLENNIKPGSIVRIPFRKKIITGIVYAIIEKSSIKNIKEITEVVEENILLPWHLKLIDWFSDYYEISFSSACLLYTSPSPRDPE